MRYLFHTRKFALFFAALILCFSSCKTRRSSQLANDSTNGRCVFPADAIRSQYIGVVLKDNGRGAEVVCTNNGEGFHQAYKLVVGDTIIGLNQGRVIRSVADFEREATAILGDVVDPVETWEFHVIRNNTKIVLLPPEKYVGCSVSSPASCGP